MSVERIDHATEARKAIESLHEKGERVSFADLAVAETHAMLALVEQQRIANLIAYAANRLEHRDATGGADYAPALSTMLGTVDFEIRKALGLS